MRGFWSRSQLSQTKRTNSLTVEQLEYREVPAYTGTGTGLLANYFSDPALTTLTATRTDPTVAFDWGAAAPAAGVPADRFSVRWTGQVQAPTSEPYTFTVRADEGVRLWVGGQQLVNTWGTATAGAWSGTLALTAGEAYDLRLEYADTGGAANVELEWATPTRARADVPACQLYGGGGWLNPDLSAPAAAGSLSAANGAFTLRGTGALGGTADQSQFAYQTVTRDGVAEARLGTAAVGTRAGVMFRAGTGAGDAFAAVVVSNGQAVFQSRAAVGQAATQSAAVAVGAQPWVRVVRNGPLLSGYVSDTGADGSWRLVGSAGVALDRAALAGLVVGSASASAVGSATFTNVTARATVPLGANIDAINDWSLANVFVDMMKQARTFTADGQSRPAATDANGWPTEACYTIVQSGFVDTARIYNGVYKLSFTGRADLSLWATPGTISNVQYNAATNRTTADVTLNADNTQGGWYFGLTFRNVGAGVRDIKLIRPGYDPNTAQVFTNEFLKTIAGFSTIRTMDFTETNGNAVANWADRAKFTDATQATNKGVAWEYVVQLANQTGKDIWITLPFGATDDYVRQLATLLRNTLNADRAVYVEFSNELWNGGFSQTHANLAAAVAAVEAGMRSGTASPLFRAGEDVRNASGEWAYRWYWAFRRVAQRTGEIGNIFASVWGQGAINTRVRPVVATQAAVPYIGRLQMEHLEQVFGDPRRVIYGVAGAPYFQIGSADQQTNLTPDQVLAALSRAVDANRANLDQYAALATSYGVEFLAYEGGPDTFGPNNIPAKKAASLDPRMRELTVRYMNDWFARGGGLFNWYMSGPTNYDTQYGTWRLTNSITNLAAPKAARVEQVRLAPRVVAANGAPVAGEVAATGFVGANPTTDAYVRNLRAGDAREYMVRVPRAGVYELRVRYAQATGTGQVRVLVNDVDAGTLSLPVTGQGYDSNWAPNSFADSTVIRVRLEEGLNVVRLNVGTGVFSLQLLKFNGVAASVSPPVSPPPASPPVSPPVSPPSSPPVSPPPPASPPPAAPPTANRPPTVTASGPTAAVTGTTAAVSAVGTDDGGEQNLRYTWALVSGPGPVTFSANGTNAAKNAVATFTRAGTYQIQVTATDAGGLTATRTVTVTIAQTLTNLRITPGSATVPRGGQLAFAVTATDQFGLAMTLPWVGWGTIGGSISGTGVYTAPSRPGTATVTASFGGRTASITVTIR